MTKYVRSEEGRKGRKSGKRIVRQGDLKCSNELNGRLLHPYAKLGQQDLQGIIT